MDAATVFDAAVRGLVVGLGAGLLALGLVVTFRSTGVLNFALGGIAAVCAFTLSSLWAHGPVPLAAALPIVAGLGAALGLGGEVVLRPVANATVVVKAIGALGLLLVLQAAIVVIWGPSDRFLPLVVSGGVGHGSLRVAWQQLAGAAVTIAAALGLSAWTARLPSGAATIAIAEDPDAARLLGIRPHRVAAVVWAIAGVLAAVAGVLLSGFTVLNGAEMTLALTTSLAAALVAGFSSIPLAVLASAAVGAVSAAATSIPRLARISGFDESVGFILVVLVALFLRPRVTAASLERA